MRKCWEQILPELVLQVVDLPVHPLVGLNVVVQLALGLREWVEVVERRWRR